MVVDSAMELIQQSCAGYMLIYASAETLPRSSSGLLAKSSIRLSKERYRELCPDVDFEPWGNWDQHYGLAIRNGNCNRLYRQYPKLPSEPDCITMEVLKGVAGRQSRLGRKGCKSFSELMENIGGPRTSKRPLHNYKNVRHRSLGVREDQCLMPHAAVMIVAGVIPLDSPP
ncbi:hypothetical protein J6590_082775 [Homalodisca vitripennis]|nr:hypothetical protein J6590_082775 [Homalodisca vitripennis]